MGGKVCRPCSPCCFPPLDKVKLTAAPAPGKSPPQTEPGKKLDSVPPPPPTSTLPAKANGTAARPPPVVEVTPLPAPREAKRLSADFPNNPSRPSPAAAPSVPPVATRPSSPPSTAASAAAPTRPAPAPVPVQTRPAPPPTTTLPAATTVPPSVPSPMSNSRTNSAAGNGPALRTAARAGAVTGTTRSEDHRPVTSSGYGRQESKNDKFRESVQNLLSRYPHKTMAEVEDALRKADGHAGSVARLWNREASKGGKGKGR
eukprot:TRINITY_DN26202_c0_g1_i1.p1 TRINITY_DN26202_c0_g1~~TRINITY_DN26202_c0_g1_i1.p1  ORF type:complete len:259 (-),score=39.57 TRINITY_DN26202_c0_g1_i1:226-1002(-)